MSVMGLLCLEMLKPVKKGAKTSNKNEHTKTVPRVAHICRRPWCRKSQEVGAIGPIGPSDRKVKCTLQAKRLNDVKHLLTITKYQAHNVPTFHLTVSLKNLQIASNCCIPGCNLCWCYVCPHVQHSLVTCFACEVLQTNRSDVDSPPKIQAEYFIQFFHKKGDCWLASQTLRIKPQPKYCNTRQDRSSVPMNAMPAHQGEHKCEVQQWTWQEDYSHLTSSTMLIRSSTYLHSRQDHFSFSWTNRFWQQGSKGMMPSSQSTRLSLSSISCSSSSFQRVNRGSSPLFRDATSKKWSHQPLYRQGAFIMWHWF